MFVLSLLLLAHASANLGQTFFTCRDWMSNYEKNALSDGVYNITSIIDRNEVSTTNSWRQVYCSFDYTRNYAWTLIESGSRSSMSSTLKYLNFVSDLGYNEDDVETYRNSLYRLSRDWMYSLYFLSDYLYSTCEFDTSFSKDWLLMRISQFDANPFFDEFTGLCVNAVSANIRGYLCQDSTVRIWSTAHVHIDSSAAGCNCTSWTSSAVGTGGEDNFGLYGSTPHNTEFSCVTTSTSTTNWWFGSDVTEYKIPTESPTGIPTIHPSLSPSNMPSNKPSNKPSDMPSDIPSKSPTTEIVTTDSPTTTTKMTSTSELSTSEEQKQEQTDEESIEDTQDTADTADGEGSSTNNDSDGISTKFIVIVAIVAGFVILCCVFCLLFTGVVSHQVRKHNESKMQVIQGGSVNNTQLQLAGIEKNINGSNQIMLRNVASTSSIREHGYPHTGLMATNGIQFNSNNHNNNSDANTNDGINPNAQEKDGPNITWQELAQLQALTSKAMNAMNAQPKVAQVQALGKGLSLPHDNVVFINNNNNNNKNNKKHSQARVGEDEDFNDMDDNHDHSDDLQLGMTGNLNNNKDQVEVAVKLAFENDDPLQSEKNGKADQNNDLLAEGGVE